jgi:predicted transcriptional regulator
MKPTMDSMLTIKLPPEMKDALKQVADRQFISISAATKQALERYLKEHGVDWREEKAKSKKK